MRNSDMFVPPDAVCVRGARRLAEAAVPEFGRHNGARGAGIPRYSDAPAARCRTSPGVTRLRGGAQMRPAIRALRVRGR
ncbi:MAG: hypothetical protein LBE67_03660 [Kocuria palustris]|nr:hypothetical protein [Kocuria palustris]